MNMNTCIKIATLMVVLINVPSILARENEIRRVGISETPVKIIFDTDLSGDWDDVGATATLLALEKNGEAVILGMGVCAGGFAAKWSPLCLNAINSYYGRPDIPIGVVRNDIGNTNSPYAKEIAEHWPHSLETKDVWDATELYRKILSEQSDSSVVMVSVGYLSNMADLLESKPDKYSKLDGIGLVKQKVKRWVCMGGSFPTGSESNLRSIPKDTKYAIENWPTPILFSGIKIGSAFGSGRGLVRASHDNPIRAAYEICCGQVGCEHANWDQTAVLAAIRDPRLYWDVKSNGYCAIIDDQGTNDWRPSPDKGHSYLVNKGKAKEISQTIDDLMTNVPYPFSDRELLVLNLKFDEIQGNVAPDASGKGHAGIFLGDHSWVPGKYGNAACFDENSNCMVVHQMKSFNVFPKKFTIAFWVYFPDSVPDDERVLIKRRVDRGKWMSIFKTSKDNKIALKIKKASIVSKRAITHDTWHHIAITYSEEKASIYFDGNLDATTQFFVSDLWMLSQAGFRLGANVDGSNMTETYFDDLFFLKDALTKDEVLEVMGERGVQKAASPQK